MARNSKFRRMLALFMTLVMIITMMPMNTLEVQAGEPLSREQLRACVKSVNVTWTGGTGKDARFRVEVTLKPGTPPQVSPMELYAAVGKDIKEIALRKNYMSMWGSTVENPDGSRTFTCDNVSVMWSDEYTEAQNALSNANSAANSAGYKWNMQEGATDEQKAAASEVLSDIQSDISSSRGHVTGDILDLRNALDAAEAAAKRFNSNKTTLQAAVNESRLNYLEKELSEVEETISALRDKLNELNEEIEKLEKMRDQAAEAAAKAQAAAEEAEKTLKALGGEDENKDQFLNTLAAEDPDNSGTLSTGIGKFWTGLVNYKLRAASAAASLNSEKVQNNIYKAREEAGENITGRSYYEGTQSALYEYNDAVEGLEKAKEVANSDSKAKIEQLENGSLKDLKDKLDEANEAINKFEAETGLGPDKTSTVTVAVSLEPGEHGDEIVYIGEVEYGKSSSSQPLPDNDEHSLTVSYVMGRNQKGEQLPKPANFKVSDGGNYPEGASYHIVSPVYTGYVADITEVVGTMGKDDVTVTVTYSCAHLNSSAHYDGLEHWMACDTCGDIVGGVKEKHYQNKADYTYTKNGHTPACGGCDWKGTVEVAHKIKLSQAQVNASQRHWVTCEVCNYEGYEAHSWERMEGYADTVCAAKCACGETYTYPEHKFTKYEPGSNGKHFRICTICGVREEEDCNSNDIVYKNATEHEIICSKCKAVQQTENHGDSLVCQHTGDQFHRTYCKKCKTTIERNIPCKLGDMRSIDTEHWQNCSDCGYEYGGPHIFPNTIYKINMRADITDGGDHLKTVWRWDEVKRCRVCGYEKTIRTGVTDERTSGGGGKKDKNFDTGASPVVRQGDHTMDPLVNQDLGAIVKTDIDNLVMDEFFDIVSDNEIDVKALMNARFPSRVSDNRINVVVQPNVTVTPTAYNGSTKVLSVEINATFNAYLQNRDDPEEEYPVVTNEVLHVNNPVEISVVLPVDFGHEGKQVRIEHVHEGVTHYYYATVQKASGRYYLNFTSTYGFSPFTIELVEEQSENDVAAVTFSYTKNDNSTAVYKTAYFDSFQNAVVAANNYNFKDQMSAEQQAECKSCNTPVLKLLKNVTVDDVVYFGDNAFVLDLDGKTLTVTENGTLDGNCNISIDSKTTPGTFISSGNIAINLCPWTGDTYNITGGTVSGNIMADGGTINISGGDIKGALGINNGADDDVTLNISGTAKISTASNIIVVYAPGKQYPSNKAIKNVHLNLAGGYYKADPRSLFMAVNEDGFTNKFSNMGYGQPRLSEVLDGYKYYKKTEDVYEQIAKADITNADIAAGNIYVCVSDYVTYDSFKLEEYDYINPQADWDADPAVYPYRIKPCEHKNTERLNAAAATCVTAGATGIVICNDCGVKIEDSTVIPALGHDYEVTYNWSDDGKSCSGTAVCKREGCAEATEGHNVTEEAKITSAVKVEPTTEKKGVTTYTASFTKAPFTTQTKDVEDIPVKDANAVVDPASKFYNIHVESGATAKNSAGTEVKTAREKEQITITWIPKADYDFVKWNVDGATPKDAVSANTVFTMPAQDVVVTYEEKLKVADQVFEELPKEAEADKDIKIKSIKFEGKKLTMQRGDKKAYPATATPVNGTELPKIYYVTDNKDIVAVDQSGNFYATGQGETTVTAYCGNKKASVNVSVVCYTKNILIMTSSMENVTDGKLELKGGEKELLTVSFDPYDSTDPRIVSWKTDNKKAVTITKGILTAKEVTAEATAKITATYSVTNPESGKLEKKTKTVTVTVKPVGVPKASAADKTHKLSLGKKKLSLDTSVDTKATAELKVNIKTKSAEATAIKIVSINSTNPDVVSVNGTSAITGSGKNGSATVNVKAAKPGTAYIIVQTQGADGTMNTQRCKVTVNATARKIVVSSGTLSVKTADGKKTMELRKGASGTIEAALDPAFSTDYGKLKITGSKGVTVKKGVIIAKKITKDGKPATITVKCGKLKETISVTVTK